LALAQATAQQLTRAAPEWHGVSAARLERLSEQLAAYVDNDQIAGSVTLVLRGGGIVYLEAFGQRDRAGNAPMREDTIFRIASQSKAIVSTAAMILQEEGKLLITDPVGDYLPEFASTTVAVPRDGGGYDVVPAGRPITIRDLLTHTSGFDYGSGVAADRWAAAGIQGYYFSDRDEPIRETVARVNPRQVVDDAATVEQMLASTLVFRRFQLLLLGGLSLVALLLAAVGVYGLVGYLASLRTSEIGLRMALGAGRGEVVRSVVAQGLRLVLPGVLVGLVGALVLTRFLARLLYEVEPTDPATFAQLALLMLGVSLAAAWLPARRASRAAPADALRGG
jgi:ABC-type antimicrobial peptide transport system permease subunit